MSKASRYWEKHSAIIFATVITALLYFIEPNIPNLKKICENINPLVSAASVSLIGFFITILTLLSSINSRTMKLVREGGAYPLLVSYIKLAIKIQFLTLLYTFVFSSVPEFYMVREYLLIFFTSWCLLASYKFTSLFMDILT